MDNEKIAKDLLKVAKELTGRVYDEFPVMELGFADFDEIRYFTTFFPETEYYGSESLAENAVKKAADKIRESLRKGLKPQGIGVEKPMVTLVDKKDDSYSFNVYFSLFFYPPKVSDDEVKKVAFAAIRRVTW